VFGDDLRLVMSFKFNNRLTMC